MKYLYWLLIFIPITLAARYGFHVSDGIVFWLCCLGIIPLAALLGDATEQISMYTGPKIGGFLNATMGNVPELLISGFAVKAGLYSLVLASLAGSILGNILLVMGMSIFIGGLKFKFLPFNKNITHNNFTLLGFASFSIIVPFFFKLAGGDKVDSASMSKFSLALAIIMVVLYVLGLIFSLITHRDIFLDETDDEEEKETPAWSLRKGVIVMSVTAVFVAVMSEMLVSTVEGAAKQYGLGEAFIGIILIPILGNVAEHAAAVIMAYKGKINISIEVAVGSSMQIAMFVTPLMIIWSAILGNTMEYVYTPMELLGIVISIIIAATVFMEVRVNWLEGAELIAAYLILGGAFLMFGI
jgi:calcium/proton exchanger (cax)